MSYPVIYMIVSYGMAQWKVAGGNDDWLLIAPKFVQFLYI